MHLGRLIGVLGFALATPLVAQPVFAQQTIRAPRGSRAQALRQRPPARTPGNKSGAQGQSSNRGGQRPEANKPAGSGEGGSFGGSARGGQVARPPNEELFKPNPRVVQNLTPGMQQRLRDMSPQEQERFLENNRRFQYLPAERQAQIRRNLQKWNSLSPAQKDQMDHAERTWKGMSPQQRDLYQNQILPKWQQLSPDRRQLINGRLHTLQGMSPAQREAALNDPRFMQGLTPDEQGVLRDLNSLRSPNPQ